MKLSILKPVKANHPDNPHGGWMVEVQDGRGQLVARFYGLFFAAVAVRRARLFVTAIAKAVPS